jgi:hypothetical protein
MFQTLTLSEGGDKAHFYIFHEEEGSSCLDPLERNTKGEIQKGIIVIGKFTNRD